MHPSPTTSPTRFGRTRHWRAPIHRHPVTPGVRHPPGPLLDPSVPSGRGSVRSSHTPSWAPDSLMTVTVRRIAVLTPSMPLWHGGDTVGRRRPLWGGAGTGASVDRAPGLERTEPAAREGVHRVCARSLVGAPPPRSPTPSGSHLSGGSLPDPERVGLSYITRRTAIARCRGAGPRPVRRPSTPETRFRRWRDTR